MNKKLAALASLTAGVALAAAPAAVQAMEPYHIKNSTYTGSSAPGRTVTIYQNTTQCTVVSQQHTLYPGGIAKSTTWESFRVRGSSDFWVHVYSGSTGQKLAERKYPAGTCVRAYTANRYFVFAPYSA